jgi:hypothetical protein
VLRHVTLWSVVFSVSKRPTASVLTTGECEHGGSWYATNKIQDVTSQNILHEPPRQHHISHSFI